MIRGECCKLAISMALDISELGRWQSMNLSNGNWKLRVITVYQGVSSKQIPNMVY